MSFLSDNHCALCAVSSVQKGGFKWWKVDREISVMADSRGCSACRVSVALTLKYFFIAWMPYILYIANIVSVCDCVR